MAQGYIALDDSPVTPGTRESTSEAARYWLAALFWGGPGPSKGHRGELAVTELSTGAGASVEVALGSAFVGNGENDVFYMNLATVATVAISENSSGNDRIDTVCVRYDQTGPTLALTVVEGTPAGSPVPPTLTQTEADYYLPLADIAVANGWTTISNSEITDRRQFAGETSRPTYIAQDGEIAFTDPGAYTDHPDFQFYAEANKTYRIEVWLNTFGLTARDFLFHFNGPTSYSYDGEWMWDGGGTDYIRSADESSQPSIQSGGINNEVVKGVFVLKTSSTAGKISFQYDFDQGGAGTQYLRDGCYMIFEELN